MEDGGQRSSWDEQEGLRHSWDHGRELSGCDRCKNDKGELGHGRIFFATKREILDLDRAGAMAIPVAEPDGTENTVHRLTAVEAVMHGMVDGGGGHPTEMPGSTGELHFLEETQRRKKQQNKSVFIRSWL